MNRPYQFPHRRQLCSHYMLWWRIVRLAPFISNITKALEETEVPRNLGFPWQKHLWMCMVSPVLSRGIGLRVPVPSGEVTDRLSMQHRQ